MQARYIKVENNIEIHVNAIGGYLQTFIILNYAIAREDSNATVPMPSKCPRPTKEKSEERNRPCFKCASLDVLRNSRQPKCFIQCAPLQST